MTASGDNPTPSELLERMRGLPLAARLALACAACLLITLTVAALISVY